MTPFAFDTLSASKRLREAGMEEGVAEAVVGVFQHAAETVDISHLATKEDIADMATKADVNALRGDVDALRVAAKADLAVFKNEMSADIKIAVADLRADFNDKLRQQSWTMLGGMAVLLAITTGAAKLLG